MPLRSRLLTIGVSFGLVAAGAWAPAAMAAPAEPAADKTSAAEARRVDRVPTPKLDWYGCFETAECATVRVPLDYDSPKGATTELAVLRVKARDQKNKIGSLFVNPGGPGGQGTAIAYGAPQFLGKDVLDRFDIVGIDPRGVGFSENVKCFKSHKDQTAAMAGLNVAFPWTKPEEKAYIDSAKAVGKGCSTTGKALAGAMSTAEVARDMDLMRRAVGDAKLSFLGFSYGSALGQYYANMFPDRVRAVAIDGVLDPISWTGTKATQDVIQDERLRSSDGAYKALQEIFIRCAKAGEQLCPLAAKGDPAATFDLVARRLQDKPVVVETPFGPFTITYATFVSFTLGSLYGPRGADYISQDTLDFLEATEPTAPESAQRRAEATRRLGERLQQTRKAPGRDFPYDNGYETFAGVACTDGLHPKDASRWPNLVAKADERAPYFGRAWGWASAACASNTWKVRDEDAYRGPFNRRTSAPVLVVGNYWDPATNYNDAVSSAKLLPNSRLLSSDSWGHTAYGSSKCVTDAMDNYLVSGALPAAGTVCVGDVQPYVPAEEQRRGSAARTERLPLTIDERAAAKAPTAGEPMKLPPVATRVPSPALG